MKLNPPARIAVEAALNTLLAFALDHYFPQYVSIFGGLAAYVIIGSLLTLMNFLVRPLLNFITWPLKLLLTLFTIIAVNALFLWLVYEITLKMDPDIVAMTISGGVTGWIEISVIVGTANWVMKHVLKA